MNEANPSRSEYEPLATDAGYLHLTPAGWVRADRLPFPDDRLETWSYQMERPAADARERDHLTRVWLSPTASAGEVAALRAKFGDPVPPSTDRIVEMICRV